MGRLPSSRHISLIAEGTPESAAYSLILILRYGLDELVRTITGANADCAVLKQSPLG